MSEEVLQDAGVAAVKITVRPNGPLRVEGPITLVDVEGNAWDLTGSGDLALPVRVVFKASFLRWDTWS